MERKRLYVWLTFKIHFKESSFGTEADISTKTLLFEIVGGGGGVKYSPPSIIKKV